MLQLQLISVGGGDFAWVNSVGGGGFAWVNSVGGGGFAQGIALVVVALDEQHWRWLRVDR